MPDGRYQPLDPRSLQGLAHPLRMRLLTALRQDGPATASRLAARLGETTGATSYHLRRLAAHGFVVDDPERGTGRERWWQASAEGTSIDDTLLGDPDPAVRGAADLFLQEVASQHAREVAGWLASSHGWSEEWRHGADLSDFTLRLTPARARRLKDELHALIESYREPEPAPGAEGTAQVRLHLHAFPRTPEGSPSAAGSPPRTAGNSPSADPPPGG
ncbi:helix-turn-helix domain-containing protein [Streptomyces sp. NPDC020141]|uniref:helix-turn-helix domain-containing protein n=1 Tax=Streptomyces sp. NPDC020141 TaxID=3365065 RepID=UPI0037BBCCAD